MYATFPISLAFSPVLSTQGLSGFHSKMTEHQIKPLISRDSIVSLNKGGVKEHLEQSSLVLLLSNGSRQTGLLCFRISPQGESEFGRRLEPQAEDVSNPPPDISLTCPSFPYFFSDG